VTLTSHIIGQLAMMVLTPAVRDAADSIIGNLDDTGYLSTPLEEIAARDGLAPADLEAALKAVQNCEPAGRGRARCRNAAAAIGEPQRPRGVAWQIVENHLKLVESRSVKELAKLLNRPQEHIQIALTSSGSSIRSPVALFVAGAREVEPDVFVHKDGDDWVVQLSDEDVPQLRLNGSYRRHAGPRTRVGQDDAELRPRTIQLGAAVDPQYRTAAADDLKVCQAIVRRQTEFLERGPDSMRPMMIKEVAEEVGVHPSTVSRACRASTSIRHRAFSSCGTSSRRRCKAFGGGIPLQTLKRMVKRMIDEEDPAKPLTDDQITLR